MRNFEDGVGSHRFKAERLQARSGGPATDAYRIARPDGDETRRHCHPRRGSDGAGTET
jgi:hypothetical protein